MAVPNIEVGHSIPSGYLIGRTSPGTGRQELISIADVARQMIALGAVPAQGASVSLNSISGTGLVVKTATALITRAVTAPAAGITVSNGDGVSGNPTFALADDLAALEAMGGTGLVARTAANTYAQRTITGTADKITLTNGDGVAGNPTITIAATYAGQNSITTLGTIATGTWQATKIGLAYGGTNADLSATGGANQFLKQSSAGAAITVGQPTFADIASGATSATATGLTISGGTLSGTTTLPNGGSIIAGGNVKTAITNSSSGLNATGGNFTLKNTDTTDNNWSRLQFLDSGDDSVALIAAQYTSHTNNSADVVIGTRPSGGALVLERFRVYSGGDMRQGSGSAIGTASTDGFFLISTCAGAPTGTPTNAGAGQIPMIYDKTNNKLYAYNGAWKSVTLA